jgi:hypothetical protein
VLRVFALHLDVGQLAPFGGIDQYDAVGFLDRGSNQFVVCRHADALGRFAEGDALHLFACGNVDDDQAVAGRLAHVEELAVGGNSARPLAAGQGADHCIGGSVDHRYGG